MEKWEAFWIFDLQINSVKGVKHNKFECRLWES